MSTATYTSKDAAHQVMDAECLACGGVKRPYRSLCSGCRQWLRPRMLDAIDAADPAELARAVAIARRERGLPEGFGVVSAEEARLRAIDDHATVGTHCCGGDL